MTKEEFDREYKWVEVHTKKECIFKVGAGVVGIDWLSTDAKSDKVNEFIAAALTSVGYEGAVCL